MATINSVNEVTAASGKILQGQGVGTASAFSTATYPSASVGTGKVLYDNGTNFVTSTPTFPASASATTRKIIVSDGTNWVASTETWATPGTSGNVLTSDGTNWTSAAASGGVIVTATGTLTSAQIKALHGTPIAAVAAQGAGVVIVPISVTAKFNYGGSNVFTASATQTIALFYGTANNIETGIPNAALTGSTSLYGITGISKSSSSIALAAVENIALNWYNSVATEITGNAANNNTMTWSIQYVLVSI